MRKLALAALAALMALAVAPAAEARRVDDGYVFRLHPVTDYEQSGRKYQKARHASKSGRKGRYSSRKSSRRSSGRHSGRRYASGKRSGRHSHAGSGVSRSCLTGAARALLGRIENQFGPVQIVSTCRPGARIATTGKISKHASGQAIDFRVPGKKAQVLRWLIANHKSGGTMTYSDMDHIHVDVGYRFVALNRPSGRS